LDAAADDELLVSGLDAHRRERHGLLARTAEAVERDAGCLDRPTGGEHGHTSDARAMVTGRAAIADDDVVDIVLVDPSAIGERVQDLRQHLLWMHVMQGAVGLPLAPW